MTEGAQRKEKIGSQNVKKTCDLKHSSEQNRKYNFHLYEAGECPTKETNTDRYVSQWPIPTYKVNTKTKSCIIELFRAWQYIDCDMQPGLVTPRMKTRCCVFACYQNTHVCIKLFSYNFSRECHRQRKCLAMSYEERVKSVPGGGCCGGWIKQTQDFDSGDQGSSPV